MSLLSPIRNIISARYASPVRTAPTPLDRIMSAVVFIQPGEKDTAELFEAVTDYFRKRNIPVRIFLPAHFNTDWIGRFKYYGDRRQHIGEEDLFISLIPEDSYASEFAARSSRAMFKIGRSQLKGKVYDFVVTPSREGADDPLDVFRSMTTFMEQIV